MPTKKKATKKVVVNRKFLNDLAKNIYDSKGFVWVGISERGLSTRLAAQALMLHAG